MSHDADTITDLAALARRWRDVVQAPRRRRLPPGMMRYAWVLADGTGRGEPCFAVVTGHGESMPLTHRLLADLDALPLVLCGEVIAVLESGDPPATDPDSPVRSLRVMIAAGFARTRPDDYATVTATVQPADLQGRPWTFLAGARPAGWPR